MLHEKYVIALVFGTLILVVTSGIVLSTEAPKSYATDLPTQAVDVQDLGNGWITFTLRVDNIKHRFLRHKTYSFTKIE